MLTKMDLAALAETIDTPYRPIPLVTTGGGEATLCICEGPKGWLREAVHDELWLVLEGVITLDPAAGRLIVSEGEIASIPRKLGHTANSGMRSPVVIFSEASPEVPTNGHLPLPEGQRRPISKRNVGVDVFNETPFAWQEAGSTDHFGAYATRCYGTSLPYQAPPGGLIAVVYRGVLDYQTADESGTVVGSQLLQVPAGAEVTFHAERGATAVFFLRKGAALPVLGTAVTGAAEG